MSSTRRTSADRTGNRERADRVRHVLLGASLVLGPALIALSTFLEPSVDWSNNADVVAGATAESALWQTTSLMAMFGFMLLVPAIVAAAELIRSRYPGLALATIILVSTTAMIIAGAILLTMTLPAAAGLDEAVIADFWTQMDELGALTVLLPLFFTAFLGYVLLAFGLWRTRATPRWVPLLFIASFGVTFFTEQGLVNSLAGTGVAVASAGMAWAYLRGEEEPTPASLPRERATAGV
jgi:hypothetical protein